MPAELLQTSIVVVSDVGVGLAKPFGDLRERQPLKEMQRQRLPLLFRQRFQHPSPAISPEKPFNSLIVVCSCLPPRINFVRLVCNCGRMETPRLHLSSAQKRARISDLEYPRAGTTLCTVENIGLSIDI